jgi:hypothetical protein
VYVGGDFTTAGGATANYVAVWNGSTWSSLGSGTDWRVNTLIISGTQLYVGGEFSTAGGNSASYIARWDGSTWHALGSGVGDYVYALTVYEGDLIVGGEFNTSGGVKVVLTFNPASTACRTASL